MADTNKSKDTQDEAQNKLLAILGTIYSFVRSRELTKTLGSYSFDDYISEAKNQIKSDKKGSRSTKLSRLDQLESDLNTALGQVQQLPDDNKD